MNLFVSILLSVVLVVGSARGYRMVEANDVENTIDGDQCTLGETDPASRLVALVRIQQLCVHPSPEFLHRLLSAGTLDENRRIFRQACTKIPDTRACVAQAATLRDACLTGQERSMFNVFSDVVGTGLDELCHNDGERMAVFFGRELKSFTVANQHRVVSCFHAMIANALFQDVTDYPAFSMQRYNSFKSLKQCFGNIARRQDLDTANFDFIVDTLIRSSKCIKKDTDDLVLCKDIASA